MERGSIGRRSSWVDEVGELLRVLARSDIEELELEHEGAELLVRRDPATRASPAQEPLPSLEPAPDEPVVVTSPLVGIFRTSGDSPERPIRAGDSVAVGQFLGAVEAMRMLNRVQSEHAGVVEELLVGDGEPVEYGQPLLVLRTS
jgi:acetyl-CoA carboxylase biotin carboxyl carrier protein